MDQQYVVATAGWSIASQYANRFAAVGTGLSRYASVFDGVEVNSSFYRRHRPSTWQGWHDQVPEHFRFAVKLPKVISHQLRLTDASSELDIFFADVAPLGRKLGPILVQIPPSLRFEAPAAARFFRVLRERYSGQVVLEPRHVSWSAAEAISMLADAGVALVYADPQLPEFNKGPPPEGFAYLRLHGSPKVYYSDYDGKALQNCATRLSTARHGSWCVFDNTALGAALGNALRLREILSTKETSNAG